MSEGRHFNNGEKHNGLPLVRRPSSAIEKAAPGAKRILSGMVADALALAKLLFTVLMHDDEISDFVEACVKSALNRKYTLRVIRFRRATELLKLTREQSFDLIFLYVFNVQWDTGAGGFSTHEAAVLGQIKLQYGKPIIATQGLDLRKEFEGTGVTFIYAPFTNEQLRDFLKIQFPAQFADAVALAKKKEREKLRVVVLDDEEAPRRACMMMLESCWQHGLEILEFQDAADAWQELSRTDPDLFITDIQHVGMTCLEMLTGLAERKVKYPVLIISARLGLELEAEKYPEAAAYIHDLKCDRRPNLNVYFLPKPYTFEKFRTVFETALKIKIPRETARRDEITSLKIRPLKIVVVNDEEFPIEAIKIILQKFNYYLDATILTFDDSEKAWQELLRTNPDLLITDDIMPALGGMEIVRRLTDRKASYPIILTTGFERTELLMCVQDCASRGLKIKLLNVPFDIESFLKVVEDSLSLKIPRNFTAPDETKPSKNLAKTHKPCGKLLVLDDEDGPRQSLRVIFEDEYDLFMAEDGVTAIELAKQNDIDVAVLDIRMAVMSGLEVLEQLKILKPDIEVIMMSGYGTNDCIRESFRLGASDYINKPFDISTIRAAVSKAMQHCTLRKRNTTKLSIAVCGHCDESFCEWLGAIFHDLLSAKYTVKIESFTFADGLFEAAQGRSFDLFIVFLNPRIPREVDAHELVATLKRQFQKPILILTNEIIYGLDSAAGFKQAGADAFFSFMPPFPPAGFKEALEKCVSKNQQT